MRRRLRDRGRGFAGFAPPASTFVWNENSELGAVDSEVNVWTGKTASYPDFDQSVQASRPIVKTLSGVKAALWDGVDDYLRSPDRAEIGGLTQMSVSMLVAFDTDKTTSSIANQWKGSATIDTAFNVKWWGGGIDQFQVFTYGPGAATNVRHVWLEEKVINTWFKVHVLIDLPQPANVDKVSFYLDGVKKTVNSVESPPPPTSLRDSAWDLELGRLEGGSEEFSGYLASYMLHSSLLTTSEMAAIDAHWDTL